MMRLGVLDVGSNSAQLQVVEVYPGAPPLPTHAAKEPTLLGEAFDVDGSIDPAGVDRVVNAVGRVLDAAHRWDVEQVYVFATSAVRDATNREEVLNRIEAETGVRPRFLSGEDEARLIYLAVRRWHGWSAGRLVVVDIGGGSMEIVLGRDAEPELLVSLPLGAGRLTRAFLHDDPPRRKQIKALRKHVEAALREVADRLRWEGEPSRAIVTSKTFKQLARLAGAAPQREGPFVRRTLTAEAVAGLVPRLAKLSADKRATLRGVSRPRARQVFAGAIVASAVMTALRIDEVELCPWALREGVMLRHLETRLDRTRDLPLDPIATPKPRELATVRTLPR